MLGRFRLQVHRSLGKRAAANCVVLALPAEINRRANSEKILNKIS
jgi:hypothetical protein